MKFYSTTGVLLFALLSISVALPAMQESPEDYDMLESAMRYIENAIAMDKLEQAMKSGTLDSLWSNGTIMQVMYMVMSIMYMYILTVTAIHLSLSFCSYSK